MLKLSYKKQKKEKSAEKKIFFHPFLYTNKGDVYHRKEVPIIGLTQVKANRHHLYPKDRLDVPKEINKEKFLLRLWEYRHFYGWNRLFQFCYEENGVKKCSELTIDEIITLMIIGHPFIAEKVGTKPWKILFREKNLNEAIDLLCRMLAWKFNYQWKGIFVFPQKIKQVVKKAA